ncbi:hypothetical protein GJ496_007358 [Pomphorhynchus laevis]|nr:hypothetical protein GJ496_007358 [Pomphorhynchus laevis]
MRTLPVSALIFKRNNLQPAKTFINGLSYKRVRQNSLPALIHSRCLTRTISGPWGIYSSSSSGKTGTTSSNNGGSTTFLCPKCGEPCASVDSIVGGTRFARCAKCNHFFVVLHDAEQNRYSNQNVFTTKRLQKPPSPKKIYDHLCKYVIGQEHAKKVIAVAVYNHYKRVFHNKRLSDIRSNKPVAQTCSELHQSAYLLDEKFNLNESLDSKHYTSTSDTYLSKSNLLMFGPTGTGKTLMAQCVAKFLEVPFAICDCTTLTQAGYVGEDVDSVIGRLLQNAENDVALAERGIVFLDEVDKIGVVPGIHQLRDVGGEGVQQAFLKMLEGTVVNVNDKMMRKFRPESTVVDTTNILFIASGAFVGLDKIVERRSRQQYLGFGVVRGKDQSVSRREATNMAITSISDPVTDKISANKLRDHFLKLVESRDLIEFGLIPEFVGRLPINVAFHSLSEEMLIQILTEPKDNLISQFRTLFTMDNVTLNITTNALTGIARQALEKDTGARGLRSILESILLDAMFDVPESEILRVLVDKDSSANKSTVKYEYSDKSTVQRDNRLFTDSSDIKNEEVTLNHDNVNVNTT